MLSGFPEVAQVDVMQASGSVPGRVVVDTLIEGSANLSAVPLLTTLTITNGASTLSWPGLRIVRSPRQYGAFMRTVLEDSRWVMRDVTLGLNCNQRDSDGNLYPASSKTIADLVAILAAASGLSLTTGTLPAYRPLADWRGKTVAEAMDQLLERTGCRLAYNPVSEEYVVSLGSAGSSPDLTGRTYRPIPDSRPATITLLTAPITYEKKFQCAAVVQNESGDLVALTDPEGIFDNFTDTVDATAKSREIHGALRLWRPSDANVSLLGRRALSIGPGDSEPVYCSAAFTDPVFASVPGYTHLVQPTESRPDALSVAFGGTCFQSTHPRVMAKSDGEIDLEAEVLAAYHSISSNGLVRSSKVEATGGIAGNLFLKHDWIKPVDSTESDVDGTEWLSLRDLVAAAVATKHSLAPQHVEVSDIVPHSAPGQLGAVRYTLKVGPQAEARTAFGFNFIPSDFRGF